MNNITTQIALSDRIRLLSLLGDWIQLEENEDLDLAIRRSGMQNAWFTEENVRQSLAAIATNFLEQEKLKDWAEQYKLPENTVPKTVGLIMAGNIPLVGFHDVLAVLIAGHRCLIKPSEKDKYLLPCLAEQLIELEPAMEQYIQFTERLEGFDAVIATGSNNSARYFETYFSKYPNIIRKNRHAVAVLDGEETEEELLALGNDVFQYFGLGCRNVAKLYVPQGYDFDPLLQQLDEYREVVMHHKYKNNFDFNYTMLILNKVPHLSTGCILLKEDELVSSRIACLHYEYYQDEANLFAKLSAKSAEIQCVVSRKLIPGNEFVPFGQAQHPGLTDYADGVDTMAFLNSLFVSES